MDSIFSVLEQSPWLFQTFAFVFGLVIGSFLNVVILRLPPRLEHEWKKDYHEYNELTFNEKPPPGLVVTRSKCPSCQTEIKPWQNIPVFSYLFLRGKCAVCQQPISARYPAIELLTGLLTLLIATKFVLVWPFLAAIVLLYFLVVISFIDLDTFLIPDQLSLSLLWLGLLISLFEFSVMPAQAVVGAVIGYMSLWSVFQVFKLVTGKEGMGYGDFKLMAAGGAWLGAEALIVVLFVASISGLLISLTLMALKKGGKKVPFGPYLSLGILFAYVYGDVARQFLVI